MTTTSPAKSSPQVSPDEAAKWAVILVLVLVAVASVMITRRLVAPIDGVATQQVCKSYGEEIGRELVSYERSNRLALVGRSDGSCLFGPAEGGTDNLVVALPEAGPGATYGAAKAMTLILQLGAASAVVRVLADPLLDRFVRR